MTRYRRRASSTMRAIVVAASTFAILLVCFSIYQSTQSGAPAPQPRTSRLPEPPAEFPDDPAPSGATAQGLALKQTVIGGGRNSSLSLYSEKGHEAFAELNIADWIPIAGSPNRFRLAEPEIRLWTRDGHGIRVVAKTGILDGRQKPGGIELNRGELSGKVVIEYDRLTREQRAKLPPELRGMIDPSQIIRAETESLEFDREYGKLVIPGELHVYSPVDLDARVREIELRLDEQNNRVESLRVARGGQVELRGAMNRLGWSGTAADSQPKPFGIVEWMRSTVHSRAVGARASAATAPSAPPPPREPPPDDDIPTFRLDEKKPSEPSAPIRYLARFEGDVDARQVQDGTTIARLLADRLDVLREFSGSDAADAERKPGFSGSAEARPQTDTPQPSSEKVMLSWSGPLYVEADRTDSPGPRSRITAFGAPLRITHVEGDINCGSLVYEPDGATAWLRSGNGQHVVVDSPGQGRMVGEEVHTEETGDQVLIAVTGPGTLTQLDAAAGAPTDSSHPAIEFQDRLEVVARRRMITRIQPSGIVRRVERVLERAAFHGGVNLHQADTALSTDILDVTFAKPELIQFDDAPMIESVKARGRVALSQGSDRLTGDELDARFVRDADNRPVPGTAVVTGNVAAMQERRTMRASDRMLIDFISTSPPGPTASEPASATPATRNMRIARVRAFGDVSVVDRAQELDLQVEELDATVADGRTIDTALLRGSDDRPAHARLREYALAGPEIRLNVADEFAEVPAAGRMTFSSLKDLDGRRLDQPIPIVVTWADRMVYQGRENRAVFNGMVHATSETTTTFDTDQLVVEFEERIAEPRPQQEPAIDLWVWQGLVDAIRPREPESANPLGGSNFSKEPARLVATGRAIVQTSELDPKSGELTGRARLAGPKLSVDLRHEVSKMLIEGEGSLLMESFRSPPESPSTESTDEALFGMGGDTGLSKTLIEWHDAMWYDFSIDQVRFEGDVRLKHFAGEQLARMTDMSRWTTGKLPPGRATYLRSDVLTVDFRDRTQPARSRDDSRIGRLGVGRLSQFQATGAVVLQDQRPDNSLSLQAGDVVYERTREILAIHGDRQRLAHVTTQKPRELPQESSFERAFYHIPTGRLELTNTRYTGQ